MKKAFEQILEKNYPAGLHKKVMRRVWFFKHQNIFFAGAAFMVVYAAASAFMLYAKMMEINFFDIIKTLFSNIDYNFELITDAIKTSIVLAPNEYILNSLASLTLIAFLAYAYKKLYKPYYN